MEGLLNYILVAKYARLPRNTAPLVALGCVCLIERIYALVCVLLLQGGLGLPGLTTTLVILKQYENDRWCVDLYCSAK